MCPWQSANCSPLQNLSLKSWSAALILQIHAREQHTHTTAKCCPNDISQSEFSGAKDCFLCISIWKRPQLLPFYRRLGKSEGKKKKKVTLHQQKDAIQSNRSETPGFPLALNTRLVLIFQFRKKRATEPDPTGLIDSLYKFPLPPLCITRVEASFPQRNGWCTCAYVLPAWCFHQLVYTAGSSVFHTSQCHSCSAEKCPTARMK